MKAGTLLRMGVETRTPSPASLAPSAPTGLDRLTEDGEVAELLLRERELADRTGRGFSWILCQELTGSSLASLEEAARTSLRSTDHVQRAAGDALLTVFPATTSAAARTAFRRPLERAGVGPEATLESGFVEPVRRVGSYEHEARLRNRLPFVEVRWERRGVAVLLARPLPRWKRAMDVAIAGLALLLALPLMLLIALGIKLTSPGPVLYTQWRTGHLFRRFRIYKFRTMKPRTDKAWDELRHLNQMTGPLFKSDHDPRIHPFGKLLRKTSMDELPQLFNVLKGDMTLIGPRALSPEPAEYEPWQLRRFDVVPGVACTWQAFRRGDTNFEEWMRSDLAWIDRRTGFLEDLRLLMATGSAVLRCAGGR
jgi:lipopolysaccharide/colanic/teichoic acid biosynthesis glycosyltransferase